MGGGKILVCLSLFCMVTASAARAANKPEHVKPKPPPPDYFPLRVNDWWKYQSTTGEGKQSHFMIKVVKAEKQPDNSCIFSVDTTTQNVIHDWYTKPILQGQVIRLKEKYGEDEKMLFTYQPAYLYIHNPLTKDDTWEWTGKGMMGVDVKESSVVSGPEEIFVPAGKYSCMKVITHVTQGGADVTKTYWFADWVGLIKSATQSGPVGSVTELLDYSFKNPNRKN